MSNIKLFLLFFCLFFSFTPLVLCTDDEANDSYEQVSAVLEVLTSEAKGKYVCRPAAPGFGPAFESAPGVTGPIAGKKEEIWRVAGEQVNSHLCPKDQNITGIGKQASVAGSVMLVDRGGCFFSLKAHVAQSLGAVAMVLVNNVERPPRIRMTSGTDHTIKIPVCSLSMADGEKLRKVLVSSSDQYRPLVSLYHNGQLNLLYPSSGGIRWHPGDRVDIKWESKGEMDNVNKKVDVHLMKGAMSLAEEHIVKTSIARNIPNSGSYSWTVPSNLPGDEFYSVMIVDSTDPSVYDISDNYFEILHSGVNLQIDIMQPSAATTWYPGQKVTIAWQYSGLPHDVPLEQRDFNLSLKREKCSDRDRCSRDRLFYTAHVPVEIKSKIPAAGVEVSNADMDNSYEPRYQQTFEWVVPYDLETSGWYVLEVGSFHTITHSNYFISVDGSIDIVSNYSNLPATHPMRVGSKYMLEWKYTGTISSFNIQLRAGEKEEGFEASETDKKISEGDVVQEIATDVATRLYCSKLTMRCRYAWTPARNFKIRNESFYIEVSSAADASVYSWQEETFFDIYGPSAIMCHSGQHVIGGKCVPCEGKNMAPAYRYNDASGPNTPCVEKGKAPRPGPASEMPTGSVHWSVSPKSMKPNGETCQVPNVDCNSQEAKACVAAMVATNCDWSVDPSANVKSGDVACGQYAQCAFDACHATASRRSHTKKWMADETCISDHCLDGICCSESTCNGHGFCTKVEVKWKESLNTGVLYEFKCVCEPGHEGPECDGSFSLLNGGTDSPVDMEEAAQTAMNSNSGKGNNPTKKEGSGGEYTVLIIGILAIIVLCFCYAAMNHGKLGKLWRGVSKTSTVSGITFGQGGGHDDGFETVGGVAMPQLSANNNFPDGGLFSKTGELSVDTQGDEAGTFVVDLEGEGSEGHLPTP
eukprot:g5226.t1